MDLGLNNRIAVVAAVDADDRAACAATLGAEGCQVVTVETLGSAATAVEGVLREQGRIDAVVMYLPIHSGRAALGSGLEALYESWSAVEAVAAAFRAAVPAMTEQRWGRLVSVTSSGAKWLGDEVDEPDAVAGLGVLGMHKAAVADVARFGISVNAVLRDTASSAEDVAGTVAFLLAESAAYLQGITLSLDGAHSSAIF